jgi:hypothetical protein
MLFVGFITAAGSFLKPGAFVAQSIATYSVARVWVRVSVGTNGGE